MLETETYFHLPEDIVIDILSRLPVRSLLQFRCVSKHWKALITENSFVRSHLSRSLLSSSHHRLLLPTSPVKQVKCLSSSDIVNTSINFDCSFVNPDTSIKILGSCNGLVCLLLDDSGIVLCNPSTRRFHVLPSVMSSKDLVYGFGYVSILDDFRVLQLPRFARDSKNACSFEVFSCNHNSWERKYLIHNFDFVDEVGTFLNGSLHWLARRGGGSGEIRVIASFSLSEEVFTEISLPPHRGRLPYYSLGVLDGCLYVLCDNLSYTHVDVWVMKKFGIYLSWTKLFTVPRAMGTEFIGYLVPLSIAEDGEVILEIDLREFVAYDTVKGTFRSMFSLGDQSWIGDAVVYVESLVSPNGF